MAGVAWSADVLCSWASSPSRIIQSHAAWLPDGVYHVIIFSYVVQLDNGCARRRQRWEQTIAHMLLVGCMISWQCLGGNNRTNIRPNVWWRSYRWYPTSSFATHVRRFPTHVHAQLAKMNANNRSHKLACFDNKVQGCGELGMPVHVLRCTRVPNLVV